MEEHVCLLGLLVTPVDVPVMRCCEAT